MSVFQEERDLQGRVHVEVCMPPVSRFVAVVPTLCFLAFFWFVLRPGPLAAQMGWGAWLIAAGAVGYMILMLNMKASRLRVTIDGKAGKLIVESFPGEAVFRIAEVDRAEFVAVDTSDAMESHKLEVVMKNGRRAKASRGAYYLYEHHRARMLAAIDAALAAAPGTNDRP
jgi:hypothetical protein